MLKKKSLATTQEDFRELQASASIANEFVRKKLYAIH